MNEHAFPSTTAIETLRLEFELLRILHHRNKNQHHLQPFFKHLSILKRTLTLLLDNVDSEFLLQKLRGIVIPKAWESFSRVVARGEFVALGLVLCASVARVSFCLGGIEESEDLTPLQETIEGFEDKEDELGEVVLRDLLAEEALEIEDIGGYGDPITLSRSPPPAVDDKEGPELDSKNQKMKENSSVALDIQGIGDIQPPAPKKRKKKHQNDIDILFAGLD
jgi:hypothetical protein